MKQDRSDDVRIYRPSMKARRFFAIMGCLMFIGGVWLLSMSIPACIEAIRDSSSRTSQIINCLMPIIGCFLVIQGFLHVRVYWRRVLILTSDAVTVEFICGLRGMKFSEILGRRSRATQYGHETLIVPKTKGLRKLVIKEGYVVDDVYRNWLASLPDLDAADKEQRRAAGKLHFWES